MLDQLGGHPLRGRVLIALFLLAARFLLLSRAAAFPDWMDCPVSCRCKWTSGKKSALCENAGLTSLPQILDPEMQVLDLSGNEIEELEESVFHTVGLINLQKVFLRKAGIQRIHREAFREMRILVEVDLTENQLEQLEPGTFVGNERLMILVLSGNPLKALNANQFPPLGHLRSLELRHCRLESVDPQALAHVPKLEKLELEGNLLRYLDARSFRNLTKLKTLTLEGNPWRCDCMMRSFRDLITGRLAKLYSMPQRCHEPQRLRNRTWEEVRPGEFACEPTVELHPSSLRTELNGNLSLGCRVTGDPEPEVWWQLNGAAIEGARSQGQAIASFSQTAYPPNDSLAAELLEPPGRWINLTLYNVTDSDAGEYSCRALNVAGNASDHATVTIPRVLSAPTLSQTEDLLLWAVLAGGLAAALCVSTTALFLGLCLCGTPRRRSRREKVKLQGSGGYGEQEKKLLDLSVTTNATTTTTATGNGPGAPPSPGELELAELEEPASVTVERLRAELCAMRALPCLAVFPPVPPPPPPPPPPVSASGIYISVALGQDAELRYPDLLDIPGHGHGSDKCPALVAAGALAAAARCTTLPRRSLRATPGASSTELGSPYDNMGPRITATGASTFNLLEEPELAKIPPPPEFVSL